MTVVYNTLKDPTGEPVQAEVEVKLVASLIYPGNGGFVHGNETEVLGIWAYHTNASGEWTADLQPNSEIEPPGTYYEVTQRYNPGRRTSKTFIDVPATGGPYWIGDLMIVSPSDIDRYVQASQVTVVPGAGITSTNVQDALIELRQAITSGTGDAHYHHDQTIPSATWTIVHMLGKNPSVSVTTSGGDQVEGAVTYVDVNTVTVSFTAAFSGDAYLN